MRGEGRRAVPNWDKGKGEGAAPAADGDKAIGVEKGRRAGGGRLPMTAPRPRGASPAASASLARRLRRPHPPVRALRRGEIECRRIFDGEPTR
uniref:Uncharacterized protein n=1 Tax=Oryza glumipatula TaxID=40148 RepID=A0A0E0ASN1_9ORYZ